MVDTDTGRTLAESCGSKPAQSGGTTTVWTGMTEGVLGSEKASNSPAVHDWKTRAPIPTRWGLANCCPFSISPPSPFHPRNWLAERKTQAHFHRKSSSKCKQRLFLPLLTTPHIYRVAHVLHSTPLWGQRWAERSTEEHSPSAPCGGIRLSLCQALCPQVRGAACPARRWHPSMTGKGWDFFRQSRVSRYQRWMCSAGLVWMVLQGPFRHPRWQVFGVFTYSTAVLSTALGCSA